jgi:hypothetical protein
VVFIILACGLLRHAVPRNDGVGCDCKLKRIALAILFNSNDVIYALHYQNFHHGFLGATALPLVDTVFAVAAPVAALVTLSFRAPF